MCWRSSCALIGESETARLIGESGLPAAGSLGMTYGGVSPSLPTSLPAARVRHASQPRVSFYQTHAALGGRLPRSGLESRRGVPSLVGW